MFRWIFDKAVNDGVESGVKQALRNFAKSKAFTDMVDEAILDAIRGLATNKDLTYVGFINKMAITIFDAANGTMSYDEAKKMAATTYEEFTAYERVRFGAQGYDWTGGGAETLAREMCIEYWD
jgi:hypothetical protein